MKTLFVATLCLLAGVCTSRAALVTNTTYNGEWYELHDGTSATSLADCIALGAATTSPGTTETGFPTCITSAGESTALYTAFDNAIGFAGTNFMFMLWGTDVAVEDDWVWGCPAPENFQFSTGKTATSGAFEDWYGPQPNDGGGGEDYAFQVQNGWADFVDGGSGSVYCFLEFRDYDECVVGSPCGAGETCANTVGSFTCTPVTGSSTSSSSSSSTSTSTSATTTTSSSPTTATTITTTTTTTTTTATTSSPPTTSATATTTSSTPPTTTPTTTPTTSSGSDSTSPTTTSEIDDGGNDNIGDDTSTGGTNNGPPAHLPYTLGVVGSILAICCVVGVGCVVYRGTHGEAKARSRNLSVADKLHEGLASPVFVETGLKEEGKAARAPPDKAEAAALEGAPEVPAPAPAPVDSGIRSKVLDMLGDEEGGKSRRSLVADSVYLPKTVVVGGGSGEGSDSGGDDSQLDAHDESLAFVESPYEKENKV